MKENNPDDLLIQYFNEVLDYEKDAREMYDAFLFDLKNPEDIEQVRKIRNDKEEHMYIVEKIINIIKADLV